MHGYKAIADALAREGVEHVFAVASEDTMELLAELNANMRAGIVLARKECGAAGMADGYSRVTGRPGVCMVTLGPGLTNTATSMTTARLHRSPVICITTQLSIFDRRGFKGGLDQRRFAETTAGKYIAVRHSETLAEDVRSAFHHIRSGAGPVVLAVPPEIMKGELDMEWEYSPAATMAPTPQKSYPDPQLIAKAVDILRTSERPFILAGRGAFDSGATEEITSLAKRTGALLGTTLLARGYLTDRPFYIGTVGPYASETVHALLSECDCVVAVGCSLNAFTMEMGLLFAEAQIIHIDQNPSQIGKTTPVSLGIVSDARAGLAALNAEMESQHFTSKGGFWNDEVKANIAADRAAPHPHPYVESPDTIDPRQLVVEMDKILPRERIVATDAGHFQMFVSNDIYIPDPSHLLHTMDFGSVGMGLFQGIGAAIGRPDRHVVVFTGDGGFMMTLEELDTAVRKRIPMTVVIMNDNAFGVEVHLLRAQGMPVDVALYDNPDFAAVARSLGAVGLTVRNSKDLPAVAAEVGRGDRPVVVDAKVNPGIVHEIFWELGGRRGQAVKTI